MRGTQHKLGKRGVVFGPPRPRQHVAVLSWRVEPSAGDDHAVEAMCDRMVEVVERHELPFIASDRLSGCAAAGLTSPSDPVLRLVLCALRMLDLSRREMAAWPLQIGIHYGTVWAGTKRSATHPFHLSGDVVALAGAVRDAARANTVTVTPDAWRHIASHLQGRYRGSIETPAGTVDLIECTGALENTTNLGS